MGWRVWSRGRTRAAAAVLMMGLTIGVGAPAFAQGRPTPPAPGTGPDEPAPVLGTDSPDAIRDRYIVVFEKNANAQGKQAARDDAKRKGAKVHHEYSSALSGFAATVPPQALEGLRHNKHVAYIEADITMTLTVTQSPTPSWGLDRVDQHNRPLSNSYTYNATGTGVKAYIIDTGVDLDHGQFAGRMVSGYDSIDGGTAEDCNGHGTHVAGTVGGAAYGVAKRVTLVAVRVLNCQGSGTNSQVIAGINWATSNHQAGQRAVANMSLGGGASSALDTAVRNSIADGITYAIAAGNSNTNACNSSPARVAEAITVGATTSSDARASYSNYGTCLDLFAPGSSIKSAWLNNGSKTISGTSMATPHAAGAAALFLQATAATPQQVRDQLVNTSTPSKVTSPGSGSPNRLLYTLGGTVTPPPPAPSTCASYPTVFTGSLSGAGDFDNHPNGNYYYSSVAGTHKGCLDGPAGVDFDLKLYRWNGQYWSLAAQGITSSPDELVSYSGTAGYYYWRVESYTGSGSYTFGMQKP